MGLEGKRRVVAADDGGVSRSCGSRKQIACIPDSTTECAWTVTTGKKLVQRIHSEPSFPGNSREIFAFERTHTGKMRCPPESTTHHKRHLNASTPVVNPVGSRRSQHARKSSTPIKRSRRGMRKTNTCLEVLASIPSFTPSIIQTLSTLGIST